MIDHEPIDADAIEREQESRKRDLNRAHMKRRNDLRSLLETKWGRRMWWQQEVGPELLAPHIADDARRRVLRDRAAERYAEAIALFPELVIKAMTEKNDRTSDE